VEPGVGVVPQLSAARCRARRRHGPHHEVAGVASGPASAELPPSWL